MSAVPPPTTILSASDKLFDQAVIRAHHLERFKNHEVREILAFLDRNVYPQILREVERLGPLDLENWEGRVRRGNNLWQNVHSNIRDLVKDGVQKATSKLIPDLNRLAIAESKWQVKAVSEAMELVVSLENVVVPSLEGITSSEPYLGNMVEGWMKEYETDLVTKVNRSIKQGVERGESIDKIVRRIRGTKANAGVIGPSRKQVKTIVRTSVAHVSNKSRLASYDAINKHVKSVTGVKYTDPKTGKPVKVPEGKPVNKLPKNLKKGVSRKQKVITPAGSEVEVKATGTGEPIITEPEVEMIKGVRIVATLDAITSIICVSMDGRQFKEGVGPRPIFHPNCRTTTVPWLATYRELGIDLDESPVGTRASIPAGSKGQQVAADLTYGDWLKTQPKDFQDDVLGPGRAAKWRAGEVTVGQFINNDLKILTLDELEKIAG